jgi:hypothetical protein
MSGWSAIWKLPTVSSVDAKSPSHSSRSV